MGRNRDAERAQLARRLDVLGEALTRFRRKAGLSKRGLAKKLGVSPNFVWRIEKGETKRWPSEEQLNKLADALAEYANEFRHAAGIVPLESKAILSKSQGLASTLELIHERFVEMLKAKGLSKPQIDYLLENATEQTILDVVNGREPLDIGFGGGAADLIAKHEEAGHQVMDLSWATDELSPKEADDMLQVAEMRDTASGYLESNRDAFLPNSLASRRRRPSKPRRETIDAGDARIVTKRPINDEERAALEAIAEVIKQSLRK